MDATSSPRLALLNDYRQVDGGEPDGAAAGKSSSHRRCLTALACVSLALLALGVAALVGNNVVFQRELRRRLVFDSPAAPGYATWRNNTQHDSVPGFQSFYFFNVSNVDGVLNGSDDFVRVREVGPYVYRHYKVRFDARWHEDGDQVDFCKQMYYVFDRERTPAHLDPERDELMVINAALQAVFGTVMPADDAAPRGDDEWWQMLVVDLIATHTNATLFTRHTPNELGYGYVDKTLRFLHALDANITDQLVLTHNYTSEAAAKAANQCFTVYTGKRSLATQDDIVRYQGAPRLHVWSSRAANRLYGNLGEAGIGPGQRAGEQRAFFVPAVFRSVTVRFNETHRMGARDELRTLKGYATAANYATANCTASPAHCDASAAGFNQLGAWGVWNLTAAFKGLPSFASQPHFYLAAPSYAARVRGLAPDPARHCTYLQVEPTTGILVEGRRLLQVNIRLRNFPDLFLYERAAPLYVPLLWVAQTAHASDAQAAQLAHLMLVRSLVLGGGYGMLGVGVACGVAFFVALLVLHARRRRRRLLAAPSLAPQVTESR